MEITTITKIGLAEITGLAEASKRQPDVNCQDTMSYALKTIERTMRDNLAETESLLIEKVFRLSRKEALESAIELVCRNSGRDEAPLMKLIKEA